MTKKTQKKKEKEESYLNLSFSEPKKRKKYEQIIK